MNLLALNFKLSPDQFWIPFLIGTALTALFTPLVLKLANVLGAVDDPKRDNRRVHKRPLARLGGLGIFGGALCTQAYFWATKPGLTWPNNLVIGLMVIGLVLVIFGGIDDLKSWSARRQLAVLMLAGVGVQFLGTAEHKVRIDYIGIPGLGAAELPWPWLGIPYTAFYLFFITKTMDTIDGLDALAGGLSLIAAAAMAVIGMIAGDGTLTLFSAAIAGACLGFLFYNWHPSRIIMGTGGPYFLGFTLASLSVTGVMNRYPSLSFVAPFLLFGVPLFDAAWVIVRRIRAKVPIYTADTRHTHHTLLRKNLGQRRVVLILHSISLCLSVLLIFLVANHG